MAGLEQIAKAAEVPVEQVRSVFSAIKQLLAEDQRIQIIDFGSFIPKIQEPRTITSPVLEGGTMTTAKRRKVSFHLAASLKKEWVIEAPKKAKESPKESDEPVKAKAKASKKSKKDSGDKEE